MAQAPGGMPPIRRQQPGLDIYGVLLIVATVFVAAATIFVFFKSATLLGTVLPVGGD